MIVLHSKHIDWSVKLVKDKIKLVAYLKIGITLTRKKCLDDIMLKINREIRVRHNTSGNQDVRVQTQCGLPHRDKDIRKTYLLTLKSYGKKRDD